MPKKDIAPQRSHSNRQPLPAVIDGVDALLTSIESVDPNCHTIECHFPRERPALDELRIACRGQRIELKPAGDGRWGYRLVVNNVPRAAFPILDKMVKKHMATVMRFDIAYDFFAPDLEALKDFFVKHGILLWNPSEKMFAIGAGVYYIDLTGRNGRQTQRCLLVYADQPAKGCHLELRFQDTPSVRRQGVNIPSDILALNPAALLKRHFRLIADVDADAAIFMQRFLRKNLAHYLRTAIREPQRPGKRSFRERYHDLIPHRIECLVRHLCPSGHAQEYHKVLRMPMKAIDLAVLNIPETLSFKDEIAGLLRV